VLDLPVQIKMYICVCQDVCLMIYACVRVCVCVYV